jgi:periplasmic protein TonB
LMYTVQAISDGMRATCATATLVVHGLILGPAILYENKPTVPEPEATVQLALIAEADSEVAEPVEPEIIQDENFDSQTVETETADAEPLDVAESAIDPEAAAQTDKVETASSESSVEATLDENVETAEQPPQAVAEMSDPPLTPAETSAQELDVADISEPETAADEEPVFGDLSVTDVEETASVITEDAQTPIVTSIPKEKPITKTRKPVAKKVAKEPSPRKPKVTQKPKAKVAVVKAPRAKVVEKGKRAKGQVGKTLKPSRRAVAGKNRISGEKAGGAVSSARYRSIVQSRLAGRKSELAVRGKGVVAIRFTIGPSGRVVSASVARSSGNGALDQAARSLVASASFPPPPGGKFSAVVPFRVN